MKSTKLWTVVALLLLTLVLIKLRGDTDRTPPSQPLAQLPSDLNGWTGHDIAIPQEQLDILGKGVFLNRLYQGGNTPGQSATVGLFIGYFPTQRSGQSIHSPQNCLPGAGWNFDSSGTTELHDVSGTDRVGEYVISNGALRQEVLYWYRSHGSNIANDYAAKFHMLRDSILYGRTDAALIRVITPVVPGEPLSAAHDRAVHFTEQLLPLLPAYIPN
ncbi:exosortase C-terminal domain/associated protein EpsI [Terriglobus aquaticus]|uniref:Exosortase C-terminal domain/associated protein EpsI n=1 Tax=Terriglobus aquaticus TaxID=940139 RepID=A0ABW9KGA8_9BACT|nr:exosortase C-terminal domain/associated protein EpsI [Terriglobus aquaticus]